MPFRYSFPCCLAAILTLTPAHSLAQSNTTAADSVSSNRTKLDDIVVTATRTPISVSEAPANVYVATADEFAAHNAYRLADVIADIPGLYFRGSPFGSTTPGSGQGGASLRGISNSRTLVLIDGEPINSGYSNGVNWSGIDLDDVARVEVVPGAFSSLYGGTAMGGVINAISKRPEKRELVVHGGAGGGGVEQWGGGFVFHDAISNGVAISLGAGYRNNGSYIGDFVVKSPTSGTVSGAIPVTGSLPTYSQTGVASYKVGDKGKRPWEQWNAFAKAYFDVGSSGKLVTGYAFDRYLTSYTPYHSYLVNAIGQPVISGTVTFSNPNPLRFSVAESDFLVLQPSSESTQRYYANYEQVLPSKALLSLHVGHETFTNFYVTPKSGSAIYGSGLGTLTDSPSSINDYDVHITTPWTSWQELMVGTGLQVNALHRRNTDLSLWRNPLSSVSTYYDSSGRSRTWGYYVQDRVKFASGLTLYLGGRFDDWHVQGQAQQIPTAAQPTLPASHVQYPARRESQFDPKASLVWQATKDLTFHASAGTAFRTPTLLDLYVPAFTTKTGPVGVRVTQADPNLKPETMRTAELGLDAKLPHGVHLTLTGYISDLRDLIYTKTIISGTANDLSEKINAGAARISGAESTLSVPLGAGFSFKASGAYTNTRITRNDAAPATIGNQLTDVPRITASSGLDWTKGALTFDGQIHYYSHSFPNGDDINATVVSHVFGSYDAYAVVSSKISFRFNSVTTISLSVDNALNRVYYAYYLQPGRTWFVEYTHKF